MKTILYIHQYFKTPEEGGALRSYFITKSMIRQGFKVVMITAHNQSYYQLHQIEGIEVHYLSVRYASDMSFRRRFLSFVHFVFSALKLVGKIPYYDCVYASSTPLTVGLIPIWIRWRKKVPYIFEVRDLWPRAPMELGVLNSSPLIFLARFLEKWIYKKAAALIALSPGIVEDIKLNAPDSNIYMIPNMADTKFFEVCKSSGPTLKIGYFGALGLANHVDFIIEMALVCQKQELDLEFIVAGKGAKKQYFKESLKSKGLENVTLMSSKNRHEIRVLMNVVDACLTSFLKIPVLETNSPNKFFDGLAAGKLSIVNTKGWLKELVEENECGFYVDPIHPEQICDKIKPFLAKSHFLEQAQQNARRLAQQKFSRSALTHQVCRVVDHVTG